MTIEQQYPRFLTTVRQNAPRNPIQPQTRTQETRTQAGRVITMVGALADGIGPGLPGGAATSMALGAATANSGPDVANAAFDTAATTLAGEGGPFVGGALMIMRGTHQALERNDQMVTYLLGMGAYVNCLARSAMGAVNDPAAYVQLPTPVVPSYVERWGDLFTPWRRQAWNAGYNKVRDVIRVMDNYRPIQGMRYAKQCFIQLVLDAGHRGGRAEGFRLRMRIEDNIYNQILATDLRRQANALRQWANAP